MNQLNLYALVLCLLTCMSASKAQPRHQAQRHSTFGKRQNTSEQLWLAANQKNTAQVNALLDRGADPNTRGDGGTTILMQSAALGDEPTIKVLLAHGANINARGRTMYAGGLGEGDFRGSTALIQACLRDDEDIVRLLLKHGARINVHDKVGTTPLSAAMWKSDWDLALFLIHSGARSTRAERKKITSRLISTHSPPRPIQTGTPN